MMCCVGGGAGGNIAKCSCANYRTHPAASFSHLRYHTLTVHTLDPFLRRSLYHSHSSRSPLTSRRFDFTNSALYLIRRAARAECMRAQAEWMHVAFHPCAGPLPRLFRAPSSSHLRAYLPAPPRPPSALSPAWLALPPARPAACPPSLSLPMACEQTC